MIEKEFLIWLITKRKLELLNFPTIHTEEQIKIFLNENYKIYKETKK